MMQRQLRVRHGLTQRATTVLGAPVGMAVPLQRRPPAVVVGMGVFEIGALAAFAATGSPAALAALLAAAATLGALAATNRRRVLAVTGDGIHVLSAGLRGRPVAPMSPGPARIVLPAPRGIGVPVELPDGRWWVDRAAFDRLRHARMLTDRAGGA